MTYTVYTRLKGNLAYKTTPLNFNLNQQLNVHSLVYIFVLAYKINPLFYIHTQAINLPCSWSVDMFKNDFVGILEPQQI